jgi:hypothetical protein
MSDASMMLRELSEPWSSGERIKSILDRTSRMCRLSYWRTYDIWYRKARRVEPYEIEQIQEALRIKRERAARNEFHELKTRLARLEAALSSRDPDFHSPDIDGFRAASSDGGGSYGTMARNK